MNIPNEEHNQKQIDPQLIGQQVGEANTAPPRLVVNCDQEAWVRERIQTAIRMALALSREYHVGADSPLFRQAIRGLVEGTAVEIIHTLNMEPGYVNLPRIPSEI